MTPRQRVLIPVSGAVPFKLILWKWKLQSITSSQEVRHNYHIGATLLKGAQFSRQDLETLTPKSKSHGREASQITSQRLKHSAKSFSQVKTKCYIKMLNTKYINCTDLTEKNIHTREACPMWSVIECLFCTRSAWWWDLSLRVFFSSNSPVYRDLKVFLGIHIYLIYFGIYLYIYLITGGNILKTI